MYTEHRTCRACGYGPKVAASGIKAAASTEHLIPVLDLGVQPLANDFQDQSGNHAGFAPLQVLFCPRCKLAQLSVVVRPDILYSNYSYITSASSAMLNHFGKLWRDIQEEGPHKGVIEIGSNTGDFLRFALDNGAQRVMGIDPAENLCAISEAKGVPVERGIFNYETACNANARNMGTDVVVARHVFCHVDDWKSFIENLKLIGGPETLYCIEVPYAPDTIKMSSWDQIYHEHLSYFTLTAMGALLDATGLHLHSARRYDIHGGAVVVMLRRDESTVPADLRSLAAFGEETMTADTWREFASRAKDQQLKLKATIDVAIAQGKTVVGFGASAKSTVWINAAKLNRQHLKFICDSTPQKQWKFSPGSEIPIVDEGALLREMPDYAVCFAWNFLADILQSQSRYLEKGGRFIVPVPEVHVVEWEKQA